MQKTNIKLMLIFCFCIIAVSMRAQQTYQQKYNAVLEHYSTQEQDSLKYKAALFLINNMAEHNGPTGTAIEKYKRSVRLIDNSQGIRQLQSLWYTSLKEGNVVTVPDSSIVTSDYLVKNIDSAWSSWQESQWTEDIDFDQFCKYILPYRINDEHIGEEWRTPLRQQYGKLIKGVKDIKRAFAIIRDTVFKSVVLSNPYCEYNLDPLTCNIIGRAECTQRCILLAAVLRSLGIPAVIDGTPMWADYSNKGHAWVSMIMRNGDTYTVYEKDSIAKRFNPIDASEFLPHYKIKEEDNCPYSVKYTKTPIKVYRICYERISKIRKNTPRILADPFIMDVSKDYGLTANIRMKVTVDDAVYLCTFLSGADWAPVAQAIPENGEVTFSNVGRNAVCVLATTSERGRNIISSPFLVGDKNIVKFFSPSYQRKQDLQLKRKYPLCSYTTDTWGSMIGGVFEGADKEDFSVRDTLAIIRTMPYGMTTLQVATKKKYRYLRYKAPGNSRSSLAELQFYTINSDNTYQLLTGKYIANGVDKQNIANVFDGSSSTICRGLSTGYTIGIDLGEASRSSVYKIQFCPSTDLNFVEPGHLYELYYFDKDWRLAERVYSKSDELIFHNMPQETLFLLKDKNGGKEERIFEYVNGKQVWH